MSDINSSTLAATVAATDHKHGVLRRVTRACRHAAYWVLGFFWILALYVIFESQISAMGAPLIGGSSTFTWTGNEILLLIAGVWATLEMLSVSLPGIDNTKEALVMALALVIYIVIFALSIVGTPGLAVFRTSEFFNLTILSAFEVTGAFMINARTLKRTIDYGSTHQ